MKVDLDLGIECLRRGICGSSQKIVQDCWGMIIESCTQFHRKFVGLPEYGIVLEKNVDMVTLDVVPFASGHYQRMKSSCAYFSACASFNSTIEILS